MATKTKTAKAKPVSVKDLAARKNPKAGATVRRQSN